MNDKKLIRSKFRNDVFERDNHKCVMCGKPAVDAHHVTDRTLMVNGGYVKENGASLCSTCHILAEEFHSKGVAYPGYSPEDLYNKINSSYEQAVKASEELK